MNRIFLVLLSFFFVASASADEVEERAVAYEEWFSDVHVSPLGGSGYAYFAAPESDEIIGYSFGDSTIWTGTYLAAESFRYAVTNDDDAKENAIRSVHALDAHLQITQVPGFIARFAGPDEAPWNSFYIGHDRYVQGTGDWEGYFFLNNTSRDQYTGWFMGMSVAYDLIDDEDTRELIRKDVREVIDTLRDNDFWILGEDFRPTDAAPDAIAMQRIAWSLIAAHIIDDEENWDLFLQQYEKDKRSLDISSFCWLNKYQEYFGINLLHENYFNLFRLEPNKNRRARYLGAFHTQVRWVVKNTHNVFFDDVYLANCERAGLCENYDEALADVREQIADFQDPPVRDVTIDIPDIPLDPFSVLMSDLIDALDLRELLDIEPQTLEPRPVRYRCPSSFMWQKTPYNIDCVGGNGTEVYPGIDFMIAYWMGRYYNLIEPGNPNEIYWPPDETDDDTDDSADDASDDMNDDQSDDAGDDTTPVGGGDHDDEDGGCCG